MSNNPIDFLFEHCAAPLRAEYEIEPSEEGDVCACCHRPRAAWREPDVRVRASVYGKLQTHCLSCQSLFQGSLRHIGKEGVRGAGHIVQAKLGMLPGCVLLVHPERTILYAPGKYFPKFQGVEAPLFDEVIELGGRAALTDALSRNLKPPFLLIGDLGKKKVPLVANLHLTTSTAQTWVCSAEGTYPLPSNLAELEQALADEVPKKPTRRLAELLNQSTYRYLEMAEVEEANKLMDEHPALKRFVRALPADPHLRKKIIALSIGAK